MAPKSKRRASTAEPQLTTSFQSEFLPASPASPPPLSAVVPPSNSHFFLADTDSKPATISFQTCVTPKSYEAGLAASDGTDPTIAASAFFAEHLALLDPEADPETEDASLAVIRRALTPAESIASFISDDAASVSTFASSGSESTLVGSATSSASDLLATTPHALPRPPLVSPGFSLSSALAADDTVKAYASHLSSSPTAAPRRPPNAFILFRNAFARSDAVKVVEKHRGGMSTIAGFLWKELESSRRREWVVWAAYVGAHIKKMNNEAKKGGGTAKNSNVKKKATDKEKGKGDTGTSKSSTDTSSQKKPKQKATRRQQTAAQRERRAYIASLLTKNLESDVFSKMVDEYDKEQERERGPCVATFEEVLTIENFESTTASEPIVEVVDAPKSPAPVLVKEEEKEKTCSPEPIVKKKRSALAMSETVQQQQHPEPAVKKVRHSSVPVESASIVISSPDSTPAPSDSSTARPLIKHASYSELASALIPPRNALRKHASEEPIARPTAPLPSRRRRLQPLSDDEVDFGRPVGLHVDTSSTRLSACPYSAQPSTLVNTEPASNTLSVPTLHGSVDQAWYGYAESTQTPVVGSNNDVVANDFNYDLSPFGFCAPTPSLCAPSPALSRASSFNELQTPASSNLSFLEADNAQYVAYTPSTGFASSPVIEGTGFNHVYGFDGPTTSSAPVHVDAMTCGQNQNDEHAPHLMRLAHPRPQLAIQTSWPHQSSTDLHGTDSALLSAVDSVDSFPGSGSAYSYTPPLSVDGCYASSSPSEHAGTGASTPVLDSDISAKGTDALMSGDVAGTFCYSPNPAFPLAAQASAASFEEYDYEFNGSVQYTYGYETDRNSSCGQAQSVQGGEELYALKTFLRDHMLPQPQANAFTSYHAA